MRQDGHNLIERRKIMFNLLLLIWLLWSVLFILNAIGKFFERLGDKGPELHVHFHPVRREIYIRKDYIAFLGE